MTEHAQNHRKVSQIIRELAASPREQVKLAAGEGSDDDALQAMIAGPDTWTVVG